MVRTCFGLDPFALDMAIETMIRESFWRLMCLKERSRGQGETFKGRFSKTKLINESLADPKSINESLTD